MQFYNIAAPVTKSQRVNVRSGSVGWSTLFLFYSEDESSLHICEPWKKEPCLTISSCSIVKVIDCEKVDPAKFLDLRIELVMESLSYQPRKSKLGKAVQVDKILIQQSFSPNPNG